MIRYKFIPLEEYLESHPYIKFKENIIYVKKEIKMREFSEIRRVFITNHVDYKDMIIESK